MLKMTLKLKPRFLSEKIDTEKVQFLVLEISTKTVSFPSTD